MFALRELVKELKTLDSKMKHNCELEINYTATDYGKDGTTRTRAYKEVWRITVFEDSEGKIKTLVYRETSDGEEATKVLEGDVRERQSFIFAGHDVALHEDAIFIGLGQNLVSLELYLPEEE